MDFSSGQVSQVLKLKTDNRPAGVGLVRSEPAPDCRSRRIRWRRVGRHRVGRVGRVADFHGHPYRRH